MFCFVSEIIYINILQKFSDTLDIINQDKLPSAALENKITPDMSVSTSSKFNDSEIPSKYSSEYEVIILFQCYFFLRI